MRLHTAGVTHGFRKPIVARVAISEIQRGQRRDVVLVASSLDDIQDRDGYAALVVKAPADNTSSRVPIVHSVRDIDHFRPGHLVSIEPANGFIRTMYRPESPHNTIFVTERCNSNCLMCSQPPSDHDDIDALTDRNLKAIDLIETQPEYLCITGGEPTLLGERLLKIISRLRDRFPGTHVHMLTNGRRFAWPDFTSEFASNCHPNFSVGIPLYADYADLHDFIVQSRDAFDQTVLGLHQLARHGLEIEIRVVLHALTIPRLHRFADYICRNLPFVDHVAFMAMEHIGYAPRNMDQLWMDPVDYQDELEGSIAALARFGIEVRLYNLQLCVLKPSLWKYAKQAISDWKNTYEGVCSTCSVRSQCGGFFQWATKLQSRGIHAISDSTCNDVVEAV